MINYVAYAQFLHINGTDSGFVWHCVEWSQIKGCDDDEYYYTEVSREQLLCVLLNLSVKFDLIIANIQYNNVKAGQTNRSSRFG